MNKVNPTTCVATSNQKIEIPDNNGRNIVLYFYPKDDTPGCTIEGNDFTELNESFAKQNTVIYGVSRDSIASHEKFKEKFNYTIDLISDEDESLCKQFDVIKFKKLYGFLLYYTKSNFSFVMDEISTIFANSLIISGSFFILS